VPAGTSLSAYSGPCTIKADTVIDGKTINCGLSITAGKVTISRSKVNGRIDVINDASLAISDSEVDGQNVQAPAIGYRNLTVQRVDVHNAQHGILCEDNCLIKDSYVHIEYIPAGAAWHMNAFLSNGGADNTLIHNTLRCSVPITQNDGGCTADAAIFGDFGPNNRYTFDNNLFLASTQISYCAYGGTDPGKPYGTKVSGIIFRNNVFEPGTNSKCGLYGTVTSFDTDAAGNVWSNNVYTNGKAVTP